WRRRVSRNGRRLTQQIAMDRLDNPPVLRNAVGREEHSSVGKRPETSGLVLTIVAPERRLQIPWKLQSDAALDLGYLQIGSRRAQRIDQLRCVRSKGVLDEGPRLSYVDVRACHRTLPVGVSVRFESSATMS